MRTWDLAIPLDPEAPAPLFQQIANGIGAAVEEGRLKAGAPLPGTRELAALLGVNRNTVVAAYDDLRAQGFVTIAPARGAMISDGWRDTPTRRRRGPPLRRGGPGFDVPPLPALPRPWRFPPGTLVLQTGVPDVRLLPVEEIARAYRRALRRHGRSLLGYGDERGHPALRSALASMLASRRGMCVGPDEVLVVHGSQMGIDLCARLLVRPGDAVAVEEIGYSPAWAALLHAGAHLVPIPVDAQGMDVEHLRAVVARTPIRAVYTTPHRQYPTTVPLTAVRRRALLELCRGERIAVLEDDYDHEIQYEGRPLLPLASADPWGVVISIGTLSKVLAPGLRLGFVTGPRAVIDKLALLRRHTDVQGDLALEEAVAELIEDGSLLRHVRRMRRIYRARRDVLVEGLRQHAGDALSFEVPRGGMALWARTAVDADELERQALALRVGISTARAYTLAGRPVRPGVRLGFAALDEEELRRATRLLGRAVRAAIALSSSRA